MINVTREALPALFIAPDKNKHPALLVIHEIWGLSEHIKDVAKRFSQQGYVVLAPDLFAGTVLENIVSQDIMEEIANPETRDEAQKKMRAALTPLQSPEFSQDMVQKLQACFTYLQSNQYSTGNVGVMGFCFGGTYTYTLAVEQPDLKVAVPFYGHAPHPLEKIAQINCPVLAFYGEQDTALVESLPDVKEAMRHYHKQFEAVVYPDTGHAFFNDTNTNMYREDAAKDAWNRTLAFLRSSLS